MYKRIAIVGIHTGIGKTIASAVIAEALGADYWKPVQAGDLDNSDSKIVASLISKGQERVWAEAVRLTQAMSPHVAAAIDQVEIDYRSFSIPDTENTLLIETAGGLLSPLFRDATMAEFVSFYKLPVILVSNNYLGSINHTLLTIEVLKNRDIPVAGLVICGRENKDSEEYIEDYGGIPVTARIPFFETLSSMAIKECAAAIKGDLTQALNNG